MRIAVHSENKRAIDAAVSAAKLHVLDLEPIKAQVGEKWPRLSDLVHALFERALKRTQGPLDRFLPAGELAYVVTFHGRSGEEAEIMCRAVAWEVCELLFGEGAGDISVRCVVGTLPLSQLSERSDAGMLADLLEKTGGETLVSKTAKPRLFSPRYPAEFFPFWDLERGTSSFLFLTPILVGQRRQATSFRRMLAPPAPQQTEEDNIAELEIRLLQAAGGYAERVQAAGKVCAIAAGVSWETLSVLHTRIRYITALKSIVPQPNCPLLVKIQDVPIGILLGRLAEMTAMLSRIGVRVLIEFEPDTRIPDLDIKLGAVGIGTSLPLVCGTEKAKEIMAMLSRRMLQQNAFSFIGGLTNQGQARLASEHDIRFAMGSVLDKGREPDPEDDIPDFPLKTDPYHSLFRERLE